MEVRMKIKANRSYFVKLVKLTKINVCIQKCMILLLYLVSASCFYKITTKAKSNTETNSN